MGYLAILCCSILAVVSPAQITLTNPTMSSQLLGSSGNYSASNAIDGNTGNGAAASGHCAQTGQGGSFPWWSAKFPRDAVIDHVNIYPRTDDCCQWVYQNVKIWVKSGNYWRICKNLGNELKYVRAWAVATCGANNKGNYIRISQENGEPLQLCEVAVYGYLLPKPADAKNDERRRYNELRLNRKFDDNLSKDTAVQDERRGEQAERASIDESMENESIEDESSVMKRGPVDRYET